MGEQYGGTSERAGVYAAFASLLVNPPDDEVQAQAFFDRLAVPCATTYVPLSEQCIRDAVCNNERWTFGPMDGAQTRHVVRCYERAGFDFRQLQGYEPIARSLRPDALAVECAFMAFLLAEDADDGRVAYANAFLETHLARWVDKAARICAETGEDPVSRLVADCAAFVAEDMQAA